MGKWLRSVVPAIVGSWVAAESPNAGEYFKQPAVWDDRHNFGWLRYNESDLAVGQFLF